MLSSRNKVLGFNSLIWLFNMQQAFAAVGKVQFGRFSLLNVLFFLKFVTSKSFIFRGTQWKKGPREEGLSLSPGFTHHVIFDVIQLKDVAEDT